VGWGNKDETNFNIPMKTQRATIHAASPNKFSTSHRKEGKCFFNSVSVISLAGKPWGCGRLDPEITLRLYGTGNKNFACLWISGQDRRGSGSAGGYGYHRPSAAAQEAINNAGISLSLPIDGRGEEAIREALLAIARALKVKRPALVESFQ
jgi:hypothetical protein